MNLQLSFTYFHFSFHFLTLTVLVTTAAEKSMIFVFFYFVFKEIKAWHLPSLILIKQITMLPATILYSSLNFKFHSMKKKKKKKKKRLHYLSGYQGVATFVSYFLTIFTLYIWTL